MDIYILMKIWLLSRRIIMKPALNENLSLIGVAMDLGAGTP